MIRLAPSLTASFFAASILILATQGGATAQTYPTRPGVVIVPFAAGGPADITGRIAADIFSKAFGQQFVVENVPGAGGATGTARAARANPDGYTLALGHMGTHAAAVALTANLPYNPETDFAPIGLTSTQPIVLATRKGFPANNLAEFVAYAKANASKLNMAHAGVGSVSYTSCLLLNHEIGIKTTMVPFTGTAPVLNAMLGEQVDYVCDPILGPLPHVRAGTLKAMAIATTKRHPALPEVPTSAEGGLPSFQADPFYAIFAPKGTPADIVDRLAEALDKGLDDETVRKRLADLGAVITEKKDRGPKALAALVKSEIARLTPILKAASAN
jgi:tripartite-type tricarboxylate transporter receptor subunit TctC